MTQERAQRFLLELPAIRNDLPFSPDLPARLFALTAEDAVAPLDAVAEAIAADQGLASRVLAMANSAFYGLQSQVHTAARAVAVLGLREIRAMVLFLAMRGLATTRPLPPDFNLGPYLDHHLAVAVAAKALAARCRAMDPDDAFTAGVLHDLGKLLVALYRPKDWQAQYDLTRSLALPWHEAEEHHWGLDHGLLGAMVLRSWNLPDSLTEPVNWHHAPQAAPEPNQPSWLLCLADACVLRLTTPPLAGPPPTDALIPALAQALGLTAAEALDTAGQALAARMPAMLQPSPARPA